MTARTSVMTLTAPVTLTPLLGFPEVRQGDDLVDIVLKALQHNRIELLDGDILVVSSKIASKAMGLFAPVAERDDMVLSQTVRVVAERMTPLGITRIVETIAGPVMAAAGVDASNTADESIVLVLPDDPDAVAAEIRGGVTTGWQALSGSHLRLGIVLSDTAGRPWRIGQTDFALGAAGLQVVDDLRGSTDADGRLLWVTERCVADEIAAAADLVKGKATGVPVAHIRGLGQYVHHGQSKPGESEPGESATGARDLVRTGLGDWFGYGAVEAVRAALGVEPGSATSDEIGIPSMGPEDVATRAGRALRVALLHCPGVSGHVDGDTIHLAADDGFALGVAATRAEVALHGEGLSSTLSADVGLTGRPSALIVFQ